MRLLDPLFGSSAMNDVFSDAAQLRAMLDFERALAAAQARSGLIPDAAAHAIASCARVELLDASAIAQATMLSANPAIPLVKQLTAIVEKQDPEAAGFVHWGATSQDLNDTALVIQMRQAFTIIESDLDSLQVGVRALAEEYRLTPLAGRTLMQQALPTSFGLKLAGFVDAIDRHSERLEQVRRRMLVVQFGGAVGTLAALGTKGREVAGALAEELSLAFPDLPWHSHRDRVAEVACMLGLLAGTLGKMARDLSLHMQTEISEVFEPAAQGRGASSTMPHKRNPVSSAVVLAAATRIPGLVSTMLAAMLQEDERGLGSWHAEWETLPEIFRLTAGALNQLATIVPRLKIDTARMRQNLEASHGLIFAEAVAMALAKEVGRSQAHTWMEAASRRARETGQHLREVLEQDPGISKMLSPQDLDRLFDPGNYLGAAGEFVDQVLARRSKS